MKIIKNNSVFTFVDNNVQFFDNLPNKIFSIEYNNNTNQYFLQEEEFDNFTIPKKIYGDSHKIADKVLLKYKNRSKNLGVLLKGNKGSGKSLTAKLICNKIDKPILVLKHWFTDTNLMEFLSNINQEFVLFIDEFEKIFSEKESQFKLLSLLDGWSNNKILFLLTSNGSKLTEYLNNRLSRIHYLFEFENPNLNFISEVLDDLLINSIHKENIIKLCNIIGVTNLDSLISIIEEVNETDDSDINNLLSCLNITSERSNYYYKIINEKEDWFIEGIYDDDNPLNGFYVDDYVFDNKTKTCKLDADNDKIYFKKDFKMQDFSKVEILHDGYYFENNDLKIKFIKENKTKFLF